MQLPLFRQIASLLFALVLSTVSLATTASTEPRVLFVGNSLTYVNSLPTIFELVAQAQTGGPRYRADMYVRGGATLAQLNQEAELHRLLDSGDYQVVVLQERGGDVMCRSPEMQAHTSNQSCDDLLAAHRQLVAEARAHGARVLYMGTYQSQPYFSALLTRSEADIARELDVPYLEISDTLRRLQSDHADLPWLHSDHSHPGIATTTLMALRVYQALQQDRAPRPFALCTASNLYTTKLGGHAFVSHDELTAPAGESHCLLQEAQVKLITDALAPAQR